MNNDDNPEQAAVRRLINFIDIIKELGEALGSLGAIKCLANGLKSLLGFHLIEELDKHLEGKEIVEETKLQESIWQLNGMIPEAQRKGITTIIEVKLIANIFHFAIKESREPLRNCHVITHCEKTLSDLLLEIKEVSEKLSHISKKTEVIVDQMTSLKTCLSSKVDFLEREKDAKVSQMRYSYATKNSIALSTLTAFSYAIYSPLNLMITGLFTGGAALTAPFTAGGAALIAPFAATAVATEVVQIPKIRRKVDKYIAELKKSSVEFESTVDNLKKKSDSLSKKSDLLTREIEPVAFILKTGIFDDTLLDKLKEHLESLEKVCGEYLKE